MMSYKVDKLGNHFHIHGITVVIQIKSGYTPNAIVF